MFKKSIKTEREFIKYCRDNLHGTIYLRKNHPRYEEVMAAIDEIKEFISSIEDDATFKVEPDELLGNSLALMVTCTLLSITELDKFCSVIKKADTIDIVPLANGNLRVTFGFEHAFEAIPPDEISENDADPFPEFK